MTRETLSPPWIASIDSNYWESDPSFQSLLRDALQEAGCNWGESWLEEMGRLAAQRIPALSDDANRYVPVLEQYDANGNRIDQVKIHPSYHEMKRLAVPAGLGAQYYNAELRAKHGEVPHVFTFALGYLFAQAEQGLYCPICMTEGAARILDMFGSQDLKDRFLPGLSANRFEEFLSGAMFLTEKQGGSDVGANTVTAVPEGDHWRLYGEKWFCSNAGDADVMMVLARPEGAQAGTRGLGLFLMPKQWEGNQNCFKINRLKDLLGTRSKGTGEYDLNGARAYAIGDVTRGFKYMTEMMNLSRLYNAVSSVALMRRAFVEAMRLVTERSAFGSKVEDFPMMRRKLVDLVVELEASTALVWETIRLWDRFDNGTGDATDRGLMRLLTPMVKYHTGKQAVNFASEAIEVLGGNGYVETFITTRLLRDGQVLPIWEGTSHILVLDILRSLKKEGSGEALFATLKDRMAALTHAELAPWRDVLAREIRKLGTALQQMSTLDEEALTLHAKTWSDRAIRIYEAMLLAAQAQKELEAGKTARKLALLGLHIRQFLDPIAFGNEGFFEDRSPSRLYHAIAHHTPVSVQDVRQAMGL